MKPPPPSPLPARHFCIIGGGIIGLFCAWHLLKRGHAVTVLERGRLGHDSCVRGSAGMICPSHFAPLASPGMVSLGLKWMWNPESPFYIKPRLNPGMLRWGWRFLRAATRSRADRAAFALRDLGLLSRRLFLELEQELGSEMGLVQKGLLMLYQTEAAAREEAHTAARARELGIPVEILTSEEIARLDPGLQRRILGGVYFPQDCHLNPAVLADSLARRIREMGAQFHWQAEVTHLAGDSRKIHRAITSAGAEFEADEFLLCGGVWSPEIADRLDVSLPMQAGKGYSLTLTNPPACGEICCILAEARVAVTPLGGAMRFGGTMEFSGTNPDINPRRVQGIIKSAARYFPQFATEHFGGVTAWSGLRPCSPDGLPYIGRFRNYENLSTATGHAMLGLSLGPATGWLIAELLSGNHPPEASPLVDPDRFL
ncbi:MAG: FAD-dependent oxidoreductase [Verrucomicrobiales bacterium]|nr:FAD-dependent oxidoreductase [Verrucomicrobiales bacterium]